MTIVMANKLILTVFLAILSCVSAQSAYADGTDCLSIPLLTGGWYEIYSSHHVWNTTENACKCAQVYYNVNVTDTTAFSIWNSCYRYGQQYNVTGWAHQVDQAYPGQFHADLDVSSGSNPTSNVNYIVMYVWRSSAGDYQHVLIGGPDADHWWLISRYPTVSYDIWNSAYKMLNAWGYNTENPHFMNQEPTTCAGTS